jgi:uncharacterized protein YndB with AHSA1/START domain
MEIEIAADKAAVWRALSTSEGVASWFAPVAEVEPGVGGKVYVKWGEGMDGTSRIEAWEPEQHLRHVHDRPEGAPPSVVDYFIEGRGGSTVMRLVQSGFEATAKFDDEFNSTRAAWPVFLQMIKHSAEQGVETCRNVTVFRMLDRPREEAWAKLMGPAPAELLGGVIRHFNAAGGCCCLEFPERQGAMLGLFCEKCSGNAMLTSEWLLYNASAEDAEALRERWSAVLDGVFGKPAAA